MKELDERKRANQEAALAAIQQYAKKWASVPKKDAAAYDWKRICKAIQMAAKNGLHGLPIGKELDD